MTADMTHLSGKVAPQAKENRDKHLKLAGVVKGVHAKLRRDFKECDGDFNKVWYDHIQNKDVLSEYANAMFHLAVDHWDKHPQTRIDWCRNTCTNYFFHGGLQSILDKDDRRKKFAETNDEDELCTPVSDETSCSSMFVDTKFNSDMPFVTTDVEELKIDLSSRTGDRISDDDISNSTVQSNTDSVPDEKCRLGKAAQRSDSEQFFTSFPEVSVCSTWGGSTCTSLDPGFMSAPVEVEADLPDGQKLNHTLVMPEGSEMATGEISPPDLVDETRQEREELLQHFIDVSDRFECSCDDQSVSDEMQVDDQCPEVVSPGHSMPKYNTVTLPLEGKIRLLDVGSCFNPFLDFDEFLAIGIDISPARESVFHCDFLHLDIGDRLQVAPDSCESYMKGLRSPIERLPRESFHVVVFSLLLEYFPSPYQRWICCQKAHKLLMADGLLIIITPDSKSQNKNAPQIKSWKTAIESLGFKRCKYEKEEHLHCMAFRKIIQSPKQDHLMDDISPDMLYIPQDFHDLSPDMESMDFYNGNGFSCDDLMNTFNNDLPVL